MDYARIPLNKIRIDSNQSRQHFDQEKLNQLADSIEEVGQLQPVIVQRQGDHYYLIAGERRLRAIKQSGKEEEIAAVILAEEINDYSLRQIQLIENLQRQDLNPLERAISIQEFIDENNLTKKAASKKLGVPRTTLTEWLNILEVKPVYQQAVLDEDSALTLSHISLASGLANRTGDPSKLNNLLDGVIKFNLSRNETKQIVDLFYKYLHMSMNEAIDVILIKREQKNLSAPVDDTDKKSGNPVKRLIKSFNRVSDHLEEVMAEVGNLEEKERENVIDQFLYIYQLLEIMIPEFKDNNPRELIERIKDRSKN